MKPAEAKRISTRKDVFFSLLLKILAGIGVILAVGTAAYYALLLIMWLL